MSAKDPTELAQQWLTELSQAIANRDFVAASAQFGPECYWRDLVSLTWNIKTAQGREAISQMLAATVTQAGLGPFLLDGAATQADGVTDAWFNFETRVGRGRGHFRLRDGVGWTLMTSLQELKGHEERRGPTRPLGTEHRVMRGRKSWSELREQEQRALGDTEQPYCVIVGAGQGGLALGARLRQLGVPTIIVERNPRAGDSWRNRYRALCLHDPVWYDHMPYLPFP
ncbi:MAG: NAD(P)/FAD-dependent oxidoreductase, partial [Quisquiliibacterium sp.]